MAIREIRVIGDPILNEKCKEIKEVNDRLKVLIDDMFDTMYENDGVGLAAPQVGILKQLTVIDIGDGNRYTFINPKIIAKDGEQTGYEGCLSVPNKTGIVTRPNVVTVKAFDENMNEFELRAEGFLARAICHELDHLNGEIYVDKVEGELFDPKELQEE